MLSCEGLAITLGSFRLAEASFSVEAGEHFVLLGQSGTGKSVLLEVIAGLLRPERGRICMEGRDITAAPIQGRGFGLVYQDHALFPHLSVAGNIGYAVAGPAAARQARIAELAEQVGASHLLGREPDTLSLGEAQRVALARALATRPRLLLLDEPLASLDVTGRSELRCLLRRLRQDGQTILHVTHDYEEAIALANHVAVLEGGRIVQCGTPDEIFHHPRSRFVAHFVGIRNFFAGRLEGGDGEAAEFLAPALRSCIATTERGGPGFMLLRSEDIILSPVRPAGSARNLVEGVVIDLEPARLGVEVQVDAGVRLFASLTRVAVSELRLAPGTRVWASWKASAARFVPDCRLDT